MKTEPTNELEMKFFAQYIGQRVQADGYEWPLVGVVKSEVEPYKYIAVLENGNPAEDGYAEQYIPTCSLLLRDLRDITDSEAIEVAKILFPNQESQEWEITHDKLGIGLCELNSQAEVTIYFVDNVALIETESNEYQDHPESQIKAYQYLLSRGFLLPFMGYDTDEIIALGWAKLKT